MPLNQALFADWAPRLLSVLRIVTALLFIQHGTAKLFGIPHMASFILSGQTAFAYFMGHAPQGFLPILNQGEPAVLFFFMFLSLAAAGAGLWSVDATRQPGEGLLAHRRSIA